MARVHIYRTYRWIDKDGVIDAVRTVVQETKLSNHRVAELSGVSASTLDGWFVGSTRKPQNMTVTAVTSALGYVRNDILRNDGTVIASYRKARALDWAKELEKQAAWLLEHGTAKQRRKRKKTNGT